MTSRLRSPAPGSVAGKGECTVGVHGSGLGEAAASQPRRGRPAAAATSVHVRAIKVHLHLEQCHQICAERLALRFKSVDIATSLHIVTDLKNLRGCPGLDLTEKMAEKYTGLFH